MSVEKNERDALIRYRIERAEKSLETAKRDFDAGDMFATSNRIYYACFYSVDALMLTKDLSYNRYGQLRKEFDKEFVESGLMDEKYSIFLKSVLKQRHMGDYGDFVRFDKDEVGNSLGKAEEFITEINKMTLKFINKQEIENKQAQEPKTNLKPESQTPKPDAPARDVKNRPKPAIKFRR